MQYLIVFSLFALMHTCVWFSSNTQFIENINKSQALAICVLLSIPTSLLGYFAARHTFETFGSVWSIKLVGFGVGYVIFPILTWVLLKESPFTLKTSLCISLAFVIIGIQLFLPDN